MEKIYNLIFMIGKIVIAGGNGFLGASLEQYFHGKAKEVILLARNPVETSHNNTRWVRWDGQSPGQWTKELEKADILINLAGKNVNCRYTEENRKLIYESRLKSTHILGEALRQCKQPPSLWINASSATIYRASYDRLMTERNGETGDDFSMDVCKKWEAAFNAQHIDGVRKIITRTSIVLGREGGALPRLINLVRAGLGGKQGKGNQYCSWIHISDFCRVIEWMVENKEASGVYNVTAPLPLPNAEFMKTLRQAMKMPVGLIAPEWLLKIGAMLIGTEPELILKSRKVYPKRLLDEGFVFEFSDIKAAMKALCQKKKTIF
jgi:uncharacterized protein